MADPDAWEGLDILSNNAAYAGFSFVVGFLLVFRTSQAYSRFWDGATKVQQMQSKWCDACGSLIAFSRKSKNDWTEVLHFQNITVRLFSLMHSLALQQIHSLHDEHFQVIDLRGLDKSTLDSINQCPPGSRVELVSAWIHQLIVDNIDTGIMPAPPPIQSRVFQELSNGTMNMNNAQKIAVTPFPFPYAQMTTVLLLIHWILTPILMCAWTEHWVWAFVWTFTPVLSFWCINLIAAEIEQPFGNDVNDLPTHGLQSTMNETLILLMKPLSGQVPRLSVKAIVDPHTLEQIYSGTHPEISADELKALNVNDDLGAVSDTQSWLDSEAQQRKNANHTGQSGAIVKSRFLDVKSDTKDKKIPTTAEVLPAEKAQPASRAGPSSSQAPPAAPAVVEKPLPPPAAAAKASAQPTAQAPNVTRDKEYGALEVKQQMLRNSFSQLEILDGISSTLKASFAEELDALRSLSGQLGSLAERLCGDFAFKPPTRNGGLMPEVATMRNERDWMGEVGKDQVSSKQYEVQKDQVSSKQYELQKAAAAARTRLHDLKSKLDSNLLARPNEVQE